MTNVVKQEDVDGVIDFATQTFGQLDILVNNAGIMDNFTPVGNLTDAEYERVMAINLTGPVKLCQAAIQVMENKKPAGSSLITPQSVTSSGPGVGRLTPWLNTLWWG
ncbi:SDR family oxidoreductase [Limosilactobacillus fermentum]|nr:SDR family oxidoreductase [Limosilactobacillus fermentum]MCT3436852.1 SDR family oxidoreductase [Limosilactobacillus fermentum]